MIFSKIYEMVLLQEAISGHEGQKMNFDKIAGLFKDNVTEEDTFERYPVYCGSNVNSHEAYFGIDITKNEKTNETVIVDSFEWDVKHSNDCVRGKSGSDDGKFFSFYLARNAFLDESKLNVTKLLKTKNNAIAAEVTPEEYGLPVMVVIHTKASEGRTRLVTAWCLLTEDQEFIADAYYQAKHGVPERLSNRKLENKLSKRALDAIEKGLQLKKNVMKNIIKRNTQQIIANGKKFQEFVKKHSA
jgi:hypothetical protein